MNRKILTLLAIFLVAISMANVCAVDLTKEYDFDGIFKMNVTDADNFTNLSDPQSYTCLLQSGLDYKNSNDSVYVFVYSGGIKDALLAITYGDIDTSYGVMNANVTTDGNLTLLNKTPRMEDPLKDYSITTFAGTSNDNFTVFVGGDNETLVKEYANTVVFS